MPRNLLFQIYFCSFNIQQKNLRGEKKKKKVRNWATVERPRVPKFTHNRSDQTEIRRRSKQHKNRPVLRRLPGALPESSVISHQIRVYKRLKTLSIIGSFEVFVIEKKKEEEEIHR